MRLKRKAALLLMAAALCVGMPANSVGATSWSCTHWQTVARPSESVLMSTSTHKVYRNEFVAGIQTYALCEVGYYWYISVKQCTRCSLVIREHDQSRDFRVHSLANDPDHK